MVTAVIACDDLGLGLGGGQELGEADAGVVAHLVQHPHGILRGEVAGSAGSEGAAAQAAQSGLDLGDTALHGSQAVGHAEAAGIMEVDHQVQGGIGSLHGGDDGLHLGGIGDADGVAQAAGGHAGVHVILQERHHGGGVLILALKGAAEGGGQVHDDIQVRIGGADLLVGLQGLLMGAVDVGLVVAHAEGHHIAHLPQAQLIGVLGTPRHQGEQVHVGILFQHHLGHVLGVRQLGDGLGADEGGVLHMLHAGGHQVIDDLELLLRGDLGALDALETVTGADFNDFNLLAHVLCSLLAQMTPFSFSSASLASSKPSIWP